MVRPVRVKIPNSIFFPEEEEHSICLFCRSDDFDAITEFHHESPIRGLSKVVSINHVRKNLAAFKDKKLLLAEHTHFICDTRVMAQLYNLLGKVFSARNNYPVPIDFTEIGELPSSIQKVVDSTYMQMKGQNVTIRLGYTRMSANSIVDNICNGVPFGVAKLSNQWKDVHSIHLKSSDSASLPIYSKVSSDVFEYVTSSATRVSDGTDDSVIGKSDLIPTKIISEDSAKKVKKSKASKAEKPSASLRDVLSSAESTKDTNSTESLGVKRKSTQEKRVGALKTLKSKK